MLGVAVLGVTLPLVVTLIIAVLVFTIAILVVLLAAGGLRLSSLAVGGVVLTGLLVSCLDTILAFIKLVLHAGHLAEDAIEDLVVGHRDVCRKLNVEEDGELV